VFLYENPIGVRHSDPGGQAITPTRPIVLLGHAALNHYRTYSPLCAETPSCRRHLQASPVEQFQENYYIAAQLDYKVVNVAKDNVTEYISPKSDSKTHYIHVRG
jgi:hypothetical protein